MGSMATGLIAFPFRYAPNGELVTIPDGSDAEIHQHIATMLLTRVGERLLVPLYGIPDPAFAGIDMSDVQAGLNTFGPAGVNVTELEPEDLTPNKSRIRIGWDRQD